MSNLNFEAEPFPAFGTAGESFQEYDITPTTLRMRPIRARILWPALGFPAVISPLAGSASKPFDSDASRCICALILSDSQDLRKEDAARYLRIVPWSQRARRKIAQGQPGSFNSSDIEVLSDLGGKRLSIPQKDDQCDAVSFGGTADGATNPIVVGLSRDVRQFYGKTLPYLYEIRVSEAASAKLAGGQYHLFWNNDAAEGTPSDEMNFLIENFAKPQRRKLGAKWAAKFDNFVQEYMVEYGVTHPPYNQGKNQNGPLTEVLHPVFVTKYSTPVRIGHVTDTHVDIRWDVYEANLKAKGKLAGSRFNNCNRNFTKIYGDANQQSDVVLLTGDLIDYGRGHVGPDPNGRYVDTLGKDDHYHEDRNWFLFYYLLASGQNYSKPTYTILGNHDWRLNPYPPFAPGTPDVWELFDAGDDPKKFPALAELLRVAHGPGHQQKYAYALETESLLGLAGKGIKAFFGDLTQDGSPLQTRIESIRWYLLLINPFLNYSFSLPSGQKLLMLDFAKDESLLNPDKPYDWLGFGPRADKCPTGFQRWMLDHFMSEPGHAKVIGVHVPPMGPYPMWSDGELMQGVKTYQRTGQDSTFRKPDGKIVKITSHPLFAIRPKDEPYGVAADYGSFAQEKQRNSFITGVSDAGHGIRLILSGHIHRRGLLTVLRKGNNWMLEDVSSFNTQNARWPLAATEGNHTYLGPLYVNSTSAGPRGHEYGAQYKSMEPGWSWMSLAVDGTIVRLTHVPPRFVPAPPRAQAANMHELEYLPSASYALSAGASQPPFPGESMNGGLNFEAEAFDGYRPSDNESYQQLEEEHHHYHGGHPMFLSARNRYHGGGRFGRWWRRRNQSGFGDGMQDSQSAGWVQNCLAQVTGANISQSGRMGRSTRRAIRKFQMQQQLSPTGRLDSNTMSALQDACGDSGDSGNDDNESRYSQYEFDQPPMHVAPPPVYTPRNCNNDKLPSAGGTFKEASRVRCPGRTDAQQILAPIVRDAVKMLDRTIAELVSARESACRGEPLGWPNLREITACWLKYKLGVCIDDPATWTAGTFVSGSIAEVIRRLVRPRDLLASNEITYVCLANCPQNVVARSPVLDEHRHCIAGTPPREIRLCPLFWQESMAPFRGLTLIHEAVHLTHCGDEDDTVGVSIGSPECLAQFVAATNGRRPVHPNLVGRCGFTDHCGKVPKVHFARNCGALTHAAAPLPDWRP